LFNIGGKDAKERIVNAAIQLFSRKGYDATRVSDIAGAAKVNKALIYYYFKSKEDILDFMIDAILRNAVSITLDFIQSDVARLVKEGYLEIRPDRLHFVDEDAVRHFKQSCDAFYERVVDYVIEKREVIRILMLESLKKGKHQHSLFRFMKFMGGDKVNPILKSLSETGHDFDYSDEIILFQFFFSIIPLVSFAAYFDDIKEVSSLSDDELRRTFLRVYQIIAASLISGNDVLLRNTAMDLPK